MASSKLRKIADVKAQTWKDSDGAAHWTRLGTVHSNGTLVTVWLGAWYQGVAYGFFFPEETMRPVIEGFLTARIREGKNGLPDVYQQVGFITTGIKDEEIKGYKLRFDCFPIMQRQLAVKTGEGIWLSVKIDEDLPRAQPPDPGASVKEVEKPDGPHPELLQGFLEWGVTRKTVDQLAGIPVGESTLAREKWAGPSVDLLKGVYVRASEGHVIVNPYNLVNNPDEVIKWVQHQWEQARA